jgi:hypothetical protein
MKRKWILSLLLITILLISGTVSAQPLKAPPSLGTGFTYQGKLADSGAPANGNYDFGFTLYDDLIEGNSVAKTSQDGVLVTDGLFTVQLDFGDVFDGTALYLEIGVRLSGSADEYTLLAPRQLLSATPYAIYAEKVPWNGIIGMPTGFADGVDNGSAYQNVLVVAKSGGDFTSIQAALDSILTASDSNRYLVYVAPGVYTEHVTMKPYVDIQGSGELTTKITFSGAIDCSSATVAGSNNAELRFLTVENTGLNTWAVSIINDHASPRLTHITATASAGTSGNYPIYNYYASPTITNVTVSASGGTFSAGMYNNTSSLTMTDVIATAADGTYTFGVRNQDSTLTMTDCTASTSGGTFSYGVYNNASSLIVNNSVINSGIGIKNYAASGTYTVQVNNSQVTGSDNTINNVSQFTTRIGATLLSGGAVWAGGGTVTCAGVYDEAYTFYASMCP